MNNEEERKKELERLLQEYKKTRKEKIYLDDQGNKVDKSEATKAIIREYDENNKMIKEIWGNITRSKTK